MARPITIDNVRFSFLSVFTAKPPYNDPSGTPKYSATILVPKSNVRAKQMIDTAIQEAVAEGRNGKWQGANPPNPPHPVYDGDGTRPSDGAEFGPECKGHWVFTANASMDYPPTVVGQDRQNIINHAEVYSGMYGSVNISFYPYSAPGRKGIGCGLNGLMKTGDGDPLGGRQQTANEMFGASVQPAVQPQYAPQPQGYAQQVTPPLPGPESFAQPASRANPFTGAPTNSGGVMGL